MRNLTPQQAQQRIESYHRGYQIHQHTFGGVSSYSSENIFWLAISCVFKLITYPIAFLVGLIIAGIAKLIYR